MNLLVAPYDMQAISGKYYLSPIHFIILIYYLECESDCVAVSAIGMFSFFFFSFRYMCRLVLIHTVSVAGVPEKLHTSEAGIEPKASE